VAEGTKVKAYRGVHASLPTLEAGQFGFTTDRNQVWVGDGVINHLVGPNPVIKQFTTAMSQSDFATMVADMTIDVIEMAAGTYQDWHLCYLDVDRSTRPLLIRPAPGAAVVWDGTTDMSTDGVFTFGSVTVAKYITFDPEGTGGSFTIQNYNIGETGLVNPENCQHITVNGFRIRSCNDSANSGSTRWVVYCKSNGTAGPSDLMMDDWDSDSDTGDGYMNHLQVDAVTRGTFKNWRVKGGAFGVHVGSGSTVIIIDGFVFDTVDDTINNGYGSTMLVRNCGAVGSGGVTWDANTVDGGGNHFVTTKLRLEKASSGAYVEVVCGDVSTTFDGNDTDGWMDYVFKSNGVEKATLSGSDGNLSIDGSLTEGVPSLLKLAGGTMTGDITLDEGAGIVLDPAGSADEKFTGIKIAGTAGATLAVGDLCYLDVTAGEWLLADADAASTSGSVVLGICILAANDGQATKMLLMGTIRSAAFPASIALGAPVYVSTSAGDITATQPSGADDVIRVVGWAVTAEPNTIYFCPSADYITHV